MLAPATLLRLAAPTALAVPLAMLLAARGAPAARPAPAGPFALALAANETWADAPGGQLIFFAVLEGLYTDGVQPDVVRAVLEGPPGDARGDSSADGSPDAALAQDAARRQWFENSLFVPCCPLCTPVLAAFETYAARGSLHIKDWLPDGRLRDTFGPGLPDDVASRLQSPSRTERLAALEGLITTWIARRLDLGRATEVEREQFRIWMEEGRKRGMDQLGLLRQDLDEATAATWPRCASCDGAVAACSQR